MSRQQKIDVAYGGSIANCPRCNVCGLPMVCGQRTRHGICSPVMPCCDTREDLVTDKAKHANQHAETAGLS